MILIIDFGSTKTRKIVSAVSGLGFTTLVVEWDKLESVDWTAAKAVILSGSPSLLTETGKLYTERCKFLKVLEMPVLGICFGHQLLGMLHGSTIFKAEEVRTETEISVIAKEKLFEGFGKTLTMVEDHTEGITLPPGFIHMASSAKYEVEAMKHPGKNMFGVQFHPEVSGENGLRLLSNFCKLI